MRFLRDVLTLFRFLRLFALVLVVGLGTATFMATAPGCATLFGEPAPIEQTPTQQWAHATNVVNGVALQLENAWRGGALSRDEFLATKGAMVGAYDALSDAEALLPEGGEAFDIALAAALRIAQAMQDTYDAETTDDN